MKSFLKSVLLFGVLTITACGPIFGTSGPTACGEWPYTPVWPEETITSAEARYQLILDFIAFYGHDWVRDQAPRMNSVTYLDKGTPLKVIQQSAAAPFVLVARGDRLVTHESEIC